MRNRLFLLGIFLLTTPTGVAADWPMVRGNAARTGFVDESLPKDLSPAWIYRAQHPPMPAWGQEGRMLFDRVNQPVVANGIVYFGSSADCSVHALDARTGQQRWQCQTNAPIRFAPVVWKDRVFVASDDGTLYCLRAADGEPLWQKRGGPDDRMILGNGRMVSRWPARGGPVVADGVLYFGAGIWPTDGIYLYALDPETGKEIWCNDQAGFTYMPQPHGTANANSGISAQGYLVVAGEKLIIPTGRAVPAVFDRKTGKQLYFHLQANGHYGGSAVVAIDDLFFNDRCAFRLSDGNRVAGGLEARTTAAGPNRIVGTLGKTLLAVDRAKPFVLKTQRGKKSKLAPNDQWTRPLPAEPESVLVAGDSVFCGGEGQVARFALASGDPLWTAKVDGKAAGLAVADGSLFVSTDRGRILCFSGEAPGSPRIVDAGASEPKSACPADAELAPAVAEILRRSGVGEGYCLDLGCGDGALACTLAAKTKLIVYGVDPDAKNVERARARARAEDLLGHRVMIHQAELSRVPYSDYFADLVVSQRSLAGDLASGALAEASRMQRPYGGVMILGKIGAMAKTVRGPIEGAGEWTHQYCNPANTGCSADTVAKAPLGMLWFARPNIDTPNRHGRGYSPLFRNGLLFTAGVDKICALNAYNGRLLWEYAVKGFNKPFDQEHLMGVSGTNSSYCAADDSLYVGYGSRCIRIDAATGKKLGEFPAPKRPDGKEGRWGWIACDGELLFGTLADTSYTVPYCYLNSDMSEQFTQALLLFALDAKTGKQRWSFVPKQRIRHNAIAVGDGRVHLIDRELPYEPPRRGKKKPPQAHAPGTLLTLDAQTGDVLWKSANDIWGTVLELSVTHDALLMSYQPTRFRLSGSEKGGKMRAYRASTGKVLWTREASYETRPLINDLTLYAHPRLRIGRDDFEPVGNAPGAWDLLTGEPKTWTNPKTGEKEVWNFARSYGCGIVSGSRNLLLFRSGTLGYVDLLHGKHTINYGGIRPGCWINTLAVGGLVLMPDSTNDCSCSYLNKASVALQPMPTSWPPALAAGER